MPVELFRRVLCLKGSAESVFLVGGFLKNPVDKFRQNGFIFQFSGWQPPSFHSKTSQWLVLMLKRQTKNEP